MAAKKKTEDTTAPGDFTVTAATETPTPPPITNTAEIAEDEGQLSSPPEVTAEVAPDETPNTEPAQTAEIEPEPTVEVPVVTVSPDAMVLVRLTGAPTAMLGGVSMTRGETRRVRYAILSEALTHHTGKFMVKYPGSKTFVPA